MPELPEVENVRRSLESVLRKNLRVESACCLSPKLRIPLDKNLPSLLAKERLIKIERRAKFLLFQFEKAALISHLGMTGKWRIESSRTLEKHDHFVLNFLGGPSLVYNDVRRFGLIAHCEKSKLSTNRWLKHLGVEPLDKKQFTENHLSSLLRGRASSIKAFLMDQRQISGVGNIYASEVLFLAKISPQKKCHRLKPNEILALVKELPKLLSRAIRAGGSTIKDYENSNGQSGRFQNRFFVYGRAGEKCRKCASLIRAANVVGRATFWCPECQR